MATARARYASVRLMVPLVAGVLLIGFGALGVARRYVGGDLLLRGQDPQIDTVLGFLLFGVAVVLRSLRVRRLAVAFSAIVAVGAVLTLIEYAFRGDAAAFLRFPPGMPSAFAGRMAADTAACFTVGGLAFLVNARAPGLARILAIGLLTVAGLGLAGVAPQPNLFAAGTIPRVVYVGFVLLGAGILTEPRRARAADADSRLMPYATGVACLLATVLLWRSLVEQQRAQVRLMTEMTAVGSLSELDAFVKSVARSLEHVAGEWEAAGRLSPAQWRAQTRLVLEFSRLRAVEWIDATYQVSKREVPVRSGAPPGGEAVDEPVLPIDVATRQALEQAMATRKPVVTPAVRYGERNVTTRIAVPLYRHDVFDGFITALFETNEMLESLLADRYTDYSIKLFDGPEQIYGPRAQPVALCDWCRAHALDLPGGRSWRLWVSPSSELVATAQTPFSAVLLVSGFLIALLLTATLAFLERATRTTRDLERANRTLQDEIASRHAAEQQIRTLASDLEERVRLRTTELASANSALRFENMLRQRAQTTLERSNADLRQFASFVSHELRQPLATMTIWTELLETSPEVRLEGRGRHFVTQLRSAIERMTSFLEGQLRLARATYTQPTFEEHVDLSELVREVADDCARELRQVGGTVEIGDAPKVRADSSQLRQLFRNLIENAVKYRRTEVPLIIRVEGGVVRRDTDEVCEVRVSDNGQGFKAEEEEKVFGLFRQLDKRHKVAGSGVGLAICRRIVEHHGGTIRAEGRPGAGATFFIDLPIERCEGGEELEHTTDVAEC